MKKIPLLFAFLLILSFLLPPLSLGQDINEALTKMIEANSKVKYQGVLTTILINTPFTQVYKYKVINYGNSYRREEFLTDATNKKINFDDGKYLWRFFPNKNLVIKEKSRLNSSSDSGIQNNLKLLKQNYTIQVVGEYNVNTRNGYKILFKPKQPDRPQQIFWVDSETGVPFRIEKYGPEHNLVSVSSFSQIKYSVPQKKDNLFLKVPTETNLTEVKEKSILSIDKAEPLMGSPVFYPHYLPSGFKLKNIVVRFQGKDKVLQLFFTDGLSSLSVFQKKFEPKYSMVNTPFGKVKLKTGREAFFKTSGTLNILNIRSQPIQITLMGEIFKKEIIKVAESLSSGKLKPAFNFIKTSPLK